MSIAPMVIQIKVMDIRLGWWGIERMHEFVFNSFDPDYISKAIDQIAPYETPLAIWCDGRLCYKR